MRKIRDTPPLEIPAWIEVGRHRRRRRRRMVAGCLVGLVACSLVIAAVGSRGIGAYAAAAVAIVLLVTAFASGV